MEPVFPHNKPVSDKIQLCLPYTVPKWPPEVFLLSSF
uniref:Uncharacterized protein n=1 Tax=Anguilla anguilla TaxID=7936 RepID=A0A0E9SCW5_ANGAN